MKYAIAISPAMRPLFRLFGFRAEDSYVELEGGTLTFRFGTATEKVPLSEVSGARRRPWPLYYGFGAKIGPDGGVSYVGSSEGVVRIGFTAPRAMNVWGPFRRASAKCAIVSLEDADGFLDAIDRAVASAAATVGY